MTIVQNFKCWIATLFHGAINSLCSCYISTSRRVFVSGRYSHSTAVVVFTSHSLCYVERDIDVAILSDRPSVCPFFLKHSDIVSKQLRVSMKFFILQLQVSSSFLFFNTKAVTKYRWLFPYGVIQQSRHAFLTSFNPSPVTDCHILLTPIITSQLTNPSPSAPSTPSSWNKLHKYAVVIIHFSHFPGFSVKFCMKLSLYKFSQ